MDIETVIRESQVERLVEPLGFQTETGKQQFSKQLRFFTANEQALRRRQDAISQIRTNLTADVKESLDEKFYRASQCESKWKIFFQRSDVEKNSYEQLTFSAWPFAQILNTFPFFLLLLSVFKLYIVPLLAILTPLFMIGMPYFILIYWYKLPLSFSQYKDLMFSMMGIQSQNFWTPKNLVQTGITCFSIVQSMVQPVQNAIHLQTINKDLIHRGECVEELATLIRDISQYIPMKNPLEDILQKDPHRSFADAWDHPFRFQYAIQLLGDAEVIYRMALTSTKPVVFQSSGGFAFANAYDPLLKESIPFSVQLFKDASHHVILTGPNRGGKSSFLRATLLNLVLAQTFGYVYADVCLLTPVHWIATGLRLEDRPGTSSMFEREVEFSVAILRRARQSPKQTGLVLFDELFHSTNPPDGSRTASLFLDQLWRLPNILSVISTHVFEIAKKAPPSVQRLCVPAFHDETGTLQFTYTLEKGICEVSSVDCILKEKGLLCGNLDSGKPPLQGDERIK